MKKRLRDLVPPWADGKTQRTICLLVLMGCALFSLWAFHMEMTQAINIVCIWKDATERVFLPNVMMHDFVTLLGPLWVLLWVPAITAALMAAFNYSGFSQGSKSVYLMRRLPDRWELARRCLTLPLVTLALSVVLFSLVLWFCWFVYTHVVPAENIPPDQWAKVWANLHRILLPSLDWRYY